MKVVRSVLLISALALCGWTIAPAQNAQPTSAPTTLPPKETDDKQESYRIGFEDTLQVQVFRHSDLTQTVNINPDGTISLFRASKPIMAVCQTERELAAAIAREYLSFLKKPEVNVVVVQKLSQTAGVIGAVEKPGRYSLNRRTRLIDLLSAAGGPSKEAGSRLIVARTGSSSACRRPDDAAENEDIELMHFKVQDVLENKENFWMQPGDVVSILDSDVVYVYGNVKEEGQIRVKEPITLTQAIVTAKGFKPSAQKDKIRVLRQKEGSAERVELIYDLGAIAKREVPDPILEPNDIVAVSEDSTKALFRKIGNSLTGGIPSLLYRVP